MGYRLHTQIKHEIEYGETEAFNYDTELIDNIICDLCEDCYRSDEYAPKDYEIDKDEFKQMIDTLKDMTDEHFNETYGNGIDGDISREYVIMQFSAMLEECDPNNSYIYLTWF